MTLTSAIRAFILADGTLAAKVGTAVYPSTSPQSPPSNYAVTKIITTMSWKKLDGATDQAMIRVEVTFWSTLADDAEAMANRLRSIVKSFNGIMGSGGVDMAVYQTLGPRSLFNDETRFFGSQLDILAIADMSTAS